MDKDPGLGPGSPVQLGGEPDPLTTTPKNRNVLSLADARRRREQHGRFAGEFAALDRLWRGDYEDGPEPPRAA